MKAARRRNGSGPPGKSAVQGKINGIPIVEGPPVTAAELRRMEAGEQRAFLVRVRPWASIHWRTPAPRVDGRVCPYVRLDRDDTWVRQYLALREAVVRGPDGQARYESDRELLDPPAWAWADNHVRVEADRLPLWACRRFALIVMEVGMQGLWYGTIGDIPEEQARLLGYRPGPGLPTAVAAFRAALVGDGAAAWPDLARHGALVYTFDLVDRRGSAVRERGEQP